MRLSDLETPVLIADLDAIERNVFRMQAYCDEHGVALRPHIKTHKLPELARLQVEAGAVGITCQKLGEAEVMADAGFDDILLSFPLVGAAKAERLAALAERVKMTVVGDSAAVAEGLAPVLARHGLEVDFLVECDTGLGRTGVQSPRRPPSWPSSSTRLDGPALRRADDLSVAARDGGVAASGARGRRGAGPHRSTGSAAAERRRPAHTHELGVVDELRVGTYIYGDRACIANGSRAARGLRAARRRDRRQPADARAGDHRRGLEDADVGSGLGRDRPRAARRVPGGGDLRAERGARLRRREPLRRLRPRSETASRSSPTMLARPRTCTTRSSCTAAARSSRRCRPRRAER